MSEDSISDKLDELFGKFDGGLSFLEEPVPIELQMKYFDFKSNIDTSDIIPDKIYKQNNNLYKKDYPLEGKQLILAQLASIEDVEAYRMLEKFVKTKDDKLFFWSVLALQECKLALESNLLDQNQVFISTGLGGKDKRLRYFIVLFPIKESVFSDNQIKIVTSEFNYSVKKNNCILESIGDFEKYITITVLIPYESSVKSILDEAVFNCNVLGNFLDSELIITNVKIFSDNEILNFLIKRKKKK